MSSRISKPNTEADEKLHECLDQDSLTCFVMIAGAGSGKTTSLIKALDHLNKTRGAELRKRGQKIACITYTDVAVEEILSDVGNSSLFHVSTIHSFLWTIIRPFQSNIRQWVEGRLYEKISEAEEKIVKPRVRPQTKDKAALDIERYKQQLSSIDGIPRYIYGVASDYGKGILGHEDILKLGPAFIEKNILFRQIVAKLFPFIFVDESQDTRPDIVSSLKKVAETNKGKHCLGFFGDPMQKIYLEGIGKIEAEEPWEIIKKPENFRSPQKVLQVINNIRSEDDNLVQTRGQMMDNAGELIPVEGTARLFICPIDEQRTEHLLQVRKWLEETNGDPLWSSDGQEADVRVLILVHRMAAKRLGFEDIYSALNDKSTATLKQGLTDGTAWPLRPFLRFILPLVVASKLGNTFEVMSLLRSHCPLFSKERISGVNVSEVLIQLKENIIKISELLESQDSTIREVVILIRDNELTMLDERFNSFLDESELGDEPPEALFLNCRANQLWGYRKYIEEESPFATQQGIKGAEFQRVLVVLDDDEAKYNLFSYGKYFGYTELSIKDKENQDKGKDSVVDRTRRLFYVCCSRATKDLAIVLFTEDVEEAKASIVAKQLFDENDIYLLG